jgi:cytoskeletal protein CcmA (bactofilin family)
MLTLMLGLAPSVQAFDARSGDRVTVGSREVIDDDLYIAGQTVTIDGTVRGDVFAAGQTVTVNGTVDGDLFAAAQSVVVNGTVDGSARVAAQAILLEDATQIGGDLLAFAFSVEQRPGSTVGRDVVATGYQALFAGSIGRNLLGAVNGLDLRGDVGGDVTVRVGSGQDGGVATAMSPPLLIAIPNVAPGLTVADSARIGGRLEPSSDAEPPVARQVPGGVAPAPVQERSIVADTAATILRHLAVLLLVGVVLLLVVPGWTRRLASTIESRPLPSLGRGLLAWLLAIAASIGILLGTVLLAVLFGVATLGPLASLTVVLGVLAEAVLAVGLIAFAGFVAQVVVSFLTGHWIVERLQPAWAAQPWVALLVGAIIFAAIAAIPILGGLVMLLAAILALGALWIAARPPTEVVPAAPPREQEPAIPAAA